MLKSLSRGKYLKSFHAGAPAGHSLTESCYVSWKFPSGVCKTDIAALPKADQISVLEWWFLANFCRFDPSIGGPYFTLGVSKLGEVPFAPDHWPSDYLLDREFTDRALTDAIAVVAARHGGQWTEVAPPPAQPSTPLLEALDTFIEQLNGLETCVDRHGVGGNFPPDAIVEAPSEAILTADKEQALSVATNVRDEILAGASVLRISALWQEITPFLDKVGRLAGSLLLVSSKLVAAGALTHLGEKLLDHGPQLVRLWEQGATVSHLIAAALK